MNLDQIYESLENKLIKCAEAKECREEGGQEDRRSGAGNAFVAHLTNEHLVSNPAKNFFPLFEFFSQTLALSANIVQALQKMGNRKIYQNDHLIPHFLPV